ncbi:unnamed protein product [Musa hybrid cultivar]
MMDRNATGKEVVGGPPRRLRMAVTTGGVFGVELGREGRGDGCVERCHSICCRRRQRMQRRGGVLSELSGGGRREGVTDAWSGALQAATSDTEGDVLSLSLSLVRTPPPPLPPLRCRFMFF